MQIASFPWDPPPPQPAPAVPAAAPAASAASAAPATTAPAPSQQAGTPSYTSAQLSPPSNAQPLPLANGLPGPNSMPAKPEAITKQEPAIKQEPGLANNGVPPAHPGSAPQQQFSGNPNGPHSVAAQRAMSQLQNQYGTAAAASISAIQGFGQGAQTQGSPAPPRPAGAPAQPGQAQRPTSQAQYAQQMANRTAAMQQQQSRPPQGGAPAPFPGQRNPATQQNGFQQSQVDGAGDDYEGVLMRRGENGETSEMGRVDIDRMLHDQIAAKAKQMEGGGLMLPLKQATKQKSNASKTGLSGPSGFDGIDDDIKREEAAQADEDAINSDLDDPDEVSLAAEDDDETIDQVMLCMYDKVQRVKNKWKCTLKDGVLNVNGKDYVFHKATGEYEW